MGFKVVDLRYGRVFDQPCFLLRTDMKKAADLKTRMKTLCELSHKDNISKAILNELAINIAVRIMGEKFNQSYMPGVSSPNKMQIERGIFVKAICLIPEKVLDSEIKVNKELSESIKTGKIIFSSEEMDGLVKCGNTDVLKHLLRNAVLSGNNSLQILSKITDIEGIERKDLIKAISLLPNSEKIKITGKTLEEIISLVKTATPEEIEILKKSNNQEVLDAQLDEESKKTLALIDTQFEIDYLKSLTKKELSDEESKAVLDLIDSQLPRIFAGSAKNLSDDIDLFLAKYRIIKNAGNSFLRYIISTAEITAIKDGANYVLHEQDIPKKAYLTLKEREVLLGKDDETAIAGYEKKIEGALQTAKNEYETKVKNYEAGNVKIIEWLINKDAAKASGLINFKEDIVIFSTLSCHVDIAKKYDLIKSRPSSDKLKDGWFGFILRKLPVPKEICIIPENDWYGKIPKEYHENLFSKIKFVFSEKQFNGIFGFWATGEEHRQI